jgi:hypothetical protein
MWTLRSGTDDKVTKTSSSGILISDLESATRAAAMLMLAKARCR